MIASIVSTGANVAFGAVMVLFFGVGFLTLLSWIVAAIIRAFRAWRREGWRAFERDQNAGSCPSNNVD
jgi:hypothetical protein